MGSSSICKVAGLAVGAFCFLLLPGSVPVFSLAGEARPALATHRQLFNQNGSDVAGGEVAGGEEGEGSISIEEHAYATNEHEKAEKDQSGRTLERRSRGSPRRFSRGRSSTMGTKSPGIGFTRLFLGSILIAAAISALWWAGDAFAECLTAGGAKEQSGAGSSPRALSTSWEKKTGDCDKLLDGFEDYFDDYGLNVVKEAEPTRRHPYLIFSMLVLGILLLNVGIYFAFRLPPPFTETGVESLLTALGVTPGPWSTGETMATTRPTSAEASVSHTKEVTGNNGAWGELFDASSDQRPYPVRLRRAVADAY